MLSLPSLKFSSASIRERKAFGMERETNCQIGTLTKLDLLTRLIYFDGSRVLNQSYSFK